MNLGTMLIRWLLLTLSVWVAAVLIPGIDYGDSWKALLIAALVLGILNTLIKPVLLLLSLPFIVVTLGLFLLVINALLLMLTAALVPDFNVDGFWSALFGSIIISLVSLFLGGFQSGGGRGGDRRSGRSDVIDI